MRAVLQGLPLAEKVTAHTIMIAVPYNWFERILLLILSNNGVIIDQEFSADVTVTARFKVDQYPVFKSALAQASHGSLEATIIETAEVILPVETQEGY